MTSTRLSGEASEKIELLQALRRAVDTLGRVADEAQDAVGMFEDITMDQETAHSCKMRAAMAALHEARCEVLHLAERAESPLASMERTATKLRELERRLYSAWLAIEEMPDA